MNPDRLHNPEVLKLFEEKIQEPAEKVRETFLAEDVVFEEAAKILKERGEFNKYQKLFEDAWELKEKINESLEEIFAEDVAHAFTNYHLNLLAALQKNADDFGALKNEVVQALNSLAGEVEEVATTVSTESTDRETIVAESSIEKLTAQYKNADYTVFIDIQDGERVHYKTFKVINREIKSVLQNAGFDHDTIDIFLRESVNRIRFEILEKSRQQSEASDINEREALSAEMEQKYQDLVKEVSRLLNEKTVGEVESLNDTETSIEVDKDIDAAVESAVLEFNLIKQSGAYAQEEAFLQAAKTVERLAELDEKDTAVAANKKKLYLRILTAALDKLRESSDEITLGNSSVTELASLNKTPASPEAAPEVVEEVTDTAEPTMKPEVAVAETEVGAEEQEVVTEGEVKSNEALFKAKREYREKQQAYKQALADYYEEQKSKATLQSQIGSGFKKITGLGLNPELPPALLAMQNEYKALRSVYAKSLDAALVERQNRPGYFKLAEGSNSQLVEKRNNAYSLDTDKAKIAFGKKFILKPNQEILALQETAVLSPEVKARLVRTMELMAKYKWATRIGIVTAAGIAGGLAGGAVLAGAGFQASKMALSALAGAGAGLGANKLTQGRVDKASAAFDSKSKEFTLDDLEDDLGAFETELLKAQSNLRSAKTTQKVATIGAAVIAGGTTGLSLASVDVDSYLTQSREGLSEEAVERIVAEEIATAPVVEPTPPIIEQAAPAVEQKPETVVAPEKIDGIKIEKFTIPFYGNSGERLFETVVPEIKIEGSFTKGDLPPETRLALEKHIKLSIDDALHAHPFMPEEKLEAEVLAKVQAKFGAAPWYAEAGITKIDIKDMSLEEYFIGNTAPVVEVSEQAIAGGDRVDVTIGGSESSYTEAQPTNSSEVVAPAERVSGIYVVEKGDTLSEITEKRFAEQLKNIPENKQGTLLEELFRNMQADVDLRNSIGMRSGDIELIYPGEKINLDGVEAELTRLLEREQVPQSVRTSGPLSVEADAGVRNVPISVVERPIPIPASVEVVADSGRVYTEGAAPVVEKAEVVPAPRPNAVNGQYAEHPAYRAFLEKSFQSQKAFEQIVDRSVTNFDNKTYDVFERPGFFGGAQYESPYRFMGEMNLQEVKEFEAQPNEKIRAFLKENNMKYETYLAWRDLIDVMTKALPNKPSTDVSDLFERYVAETLVPNANPLIKKS